MTRALVLTDDYENSPYADEWVWVEVTPDTATERAAQEWAEGHFLYEDEELPAYGCPRAAQEWAEGHFLYEDEELPAYGCPTKRVWMTPGLDEGAWILCAPGTEDARGFWEIDITSMPDQRNDAHHILDAAAPEKTLCSLPAPGLSVLPADTTVWPDGNAACWTCWDRARAILSEQNHD